MSKLLARPMHGEKVVAFSMGFYRDIADVSDKSNAALHDEMICNYSDAAQQSFGEIKLLFCCSS
jgi:hypothetical protein